MYARLLVVGGSLLTRPKGEGISYFRASVASTKESVETDTEAKSATERVARYECYGSSSSRAAELDKQARRLFSDFPKGLYPDEIIIYVYTGSLLLQLLLELPETEPDLRRSIDRSGANPLPSVLKAMFSTAL